MIALSQSPALGRCRSKGVGQLRSLLLRPGKCARGAAMVFAIGLATAVQAQTAPQDPDSLIAQSLTPEAGIGLARQQISDGDLLGAAATLERVIITRDDAVEPRLL